MKKNDLKKILKMEPVSYELEVATNQYMRSLEKKVFWYPIYADFALKRRKYGKLTAMVKNIEMTRESISYRGIIKYFGDIIFFCRKNVLNI